MLGVRYAPYVVVVSQGIRMDLALQLNSFIRLGSLWMPMVLSLSLIVLIIGSVR